MKNCSLDVVRDLRRGASDESGIVLEQIAGNRSDTILLLWEGTEDVDKIGDVLWCTGKVVKFLSFRLRKISRALNEGRWDGRLTTVISRWTAALLSVESRIVWRISCNPASVGAQEAMAVWKE